MRDLNQYFVYCLLALLFFMKNCVLMKTKYNAMSGIGGIVIISYSIWTVFLKGKQYWVSSYFVVYIHTKIERYHINQIKYTWNPD